MTVHIFAFRVSLKFTSEMKKIRKSTRSGRPDLTDIHQLLRSILLDFQDCEGVIRITTNKCKKRQP